LRLGSSDARGLIPQRPMHIRRGAPVVIDEELGQEDDRQGILRGISTSRGITTGGGVAYFPYQE
jgi:hypothetical protein